MALEINLYISPHIGDGLTLATAFRSKVCDYLNSAVGEWADNMNHPSRYYFIDVVYAEPATHQQIQADPAITRLLPVVSATKSQIVTHMGTSLANLFSTQQLTAIRNKLESIGIDMEWADSDTTFRQLVRRILHQHMIAQRCEGSWGKELLYILSLPLTDTVGSLSAAQRQLAKDWMTRRGIDHSWITLSTTIREIVRRIYDSLPKETLDVGQVGVL